MLACHRFIGGARRDLHHIRPPRIKWSVRTASHPIPEILEKLSIEPLNSGACHGDWIASPSGGEMESINPASGEPLAKVKMAGLAEYECGVARARLDLNVCNDGDPLMCLHSAKMRRRSC